MSIHARPDHDWLQKLTAESTLGQLPAHDATVPPDVLTSIIDRELSAAPELPGVIVVDGEQLSGMISRPQLLAQLSRPFGQELYLKRPVRLLLEAQREHPLVLPSGLLVGDAAHAALQRSAESVYEPIVVDSTTHFLLLDVHTLLIAQSRLLAIANDKIRCQADLAEAANRAKSAFLANMSHEIRTPLTAILGFAENLMDLEIGVDDRMFAVETILRNGHHLLQLINDILDLSKIEAGRLEIECLPFSPGLLMTEAISALRGRAEAKSIGLSLAYDGPIPDLIESDPTRFRQILMNLISNAIKFTESGRVIVRMEMIDVGSNSRAWKLKCDVIDSGIGMTPDQLEKLFSPFVQADQSMTRRFGGTGLGLSISRRLAQLLGGDIVVTSQPGVGSRFSLMIDAGVDAGVAWQDRLSANDEPTHSVSAASDRRLSGRILLAEDGPDNQILIASMLRKYGAEVTVVDNGQKAVDAALASLTTGRPFQIILMDMQMPVVDGYNATSELRARGWTRPILALTANAMQGDRQKCLQAGCDDFATKPINRAELIERIDSLCNDEISRTQCNGDRTPSQARTSPETHPIDANLALDRAGGDPDLLSQIARLLMKVGPEWLNDLQQHLRENDSPSVRRVAHSLKNSAENLGGLIASEALSRLEQAAAANRVDDALLIWPECHERFVDLLSAIKTQLKISG